ncbi:hypothetical protein [Blastococcus goldschmidtiae]|uniref:DUF5666 domain-containing protein n=1 Tax=Blastococcus goldschmidtiae TaxID=3075546 RepID=A0ABU2KA82_9ACTN|nr:hypothetical protein [Blastococcus sp. DSM 46792]MDT0277105.1 hypothetical protein [Blastococcus sp. DSM 46792]
MNSPRRTAVVARRGGPAGVLLATVLGLAACSGPADTEPTATTAAELTEVREEVAGLRDRVATLEDRVGDLQDRLAEGGADEPVGEPDAPGDGPPDGAPPESDPSFFGEPEAPLGEQVTVRGEVVELVASTSIASVLRVAGEAGEPVAVVTVTPSSDIGTGDEVEVSGTVLDVDPDTFEADFGIAADELFDDPQAWLDDAEGQIAIAATRIEAVPAPSGS